MFRPVSPLFASSIERANDVDLRMTDEAGQLTGPGFGKVLLKPSFQEFGIGKVLLTLAANVEAATQNSNRVAQVMDTPPHKDIYYLASNNTNSAEDIGSHTLMAKDSVREQPLRDKADAFARFAVSTVINAFKTQVENRSSSPVDWGDLLRRLLCHPAQAPSDWARKFVAPDSAQPADPKETFLPKPLPQFEVSKVLQDGNKRTAALEKSYRELFGKAYATWQKEVEKLRNMNMP
jgi:hypothetical protein